MYEDGRWAANEGTIINVPSLQEIGKYRLARTLIHVMMLEQPCVEKATLICAH